MFGLSSQLTMAAIGAKRWIATDGCGGGSVTFRRPELAGPDVRRDAWRRNAASVAHLRMGWKVPVLCKVGAELCKRRPGSFPTKDNSSISLIRHCSDSVPDATWVRKKFKSRLPHPYSCTHQKQLRRHGDRNSGKEEAKRYTLNSRRRNCRRCRNL